MKIECSGVAKATRIKLTQLVPALKSRAKIIRRYAAITRLAKALSV